MDIQTQKALSEHVTKKVNEGQTIYQAIKAFYKGEIFAENYKDAQRLLDDHTPALRFVSELPVKTDNGLFIVTVFNHLNKYATKNVYEISIEKL